MELSGFFGLFFFWGASCGTDDDTKGNKQHDVPKCGATMIVRHCLVCFLVVLVVLLKPLCVFSTLTLLPLSHSLLQVSS
jgi:hypothetical protein